MHILLKSQSVVFQNGQLILLVMMSSNTNYIVSYIHELVYHLEQNNVPIIQNKLSYCINVIHVHKQTSLHVVQLIVLENQEIMKTLY